ncbi:MAG: methylthioribulose 1-phosphate dehydratase [Ketobacteraceae bacterium]|nr:methylthioribulose 1-phosphate dehydratase [Ketobacteraceae bacterium]
MSRTEALKQLIELGRWIQSNGWCPATSGNLSCRPAEDDSDAFFWISVSGKYKGELDTGDFLPVNQQGQPVNTDKIPSAETLLHNLIYQYFPDTGFVLHTHSVYGTVLGQATGVGTLALHDYELQKAFKGIETHEGVFGIPVFANSQDMKALSTEIEEHLRECQQLHGFILAGHGLYTWGRTAAEAKRHLEALEFLFECEYKLRLLQRGEQR